PPRSSPRLPYTTLFRSRALEPGRRLLVPFGARKAIGFSLGKAREAPPGETRDVLAVLDEAPVLPADLLELLRFAADYYLHPLGRSEEHTSELQSRENLV